MPALILQKCRAWNRMWSDQAVSRFHEPRVGSGCSIKVAEWTPGFSAGLARAGRRGRPWGSGALCWSWRRNARSRGPRATGFTARWGLGPLPWPSTRASAPPRCTHGGGPGPCELRQHSEPRRPQRQPGRPPAGVHRALPGGGRWANTDANPPAGGAAQGPRDTLQPIGESCGSASNTLPESGVFTTLTAPPGPSLGLAGPAHRAAAGPPCSRPCPLRLFTRSCEAKVRSRRPSTQTSPVAPISSRVTKSLRRPGAPRTARSP